MKTNNNVHTDKERIDSILDQCPICYVGMADTDGTPYVIPMNFGYTGTTLYLHSAQEGRSISILEKNPKVCLSFCPSTELVYRHEQVACSYGMRATSVMCWGKVEFEEDYDKKVEALNILMKHYTDRTFTYAPPAIRNIKIWRVEIEEMTCKEFRTQYGK